MKQSALIMIILIVAGLVLAGAGVLMQKSAPADQGKSIVAEGWTNPTKPTVQDWADLANNVTHTWSMIATNRSQITDATTANISSSSANVISASSANVSMAISASSANVSMAIAASSTNISALRGNATTVMVNSTADPLYNLTASWTQITVTGTQSLNFTTPSAGSYLVTANINENMTLSSVTAGTHSQFALCDANNTAVVTNSERMGTMLAGISNATSLGRSYSWIYTNATGAAEVGICGRVSAAPDGRWAVVSDSTGRSTISYVRLP